MFTIKFSQKAIKDLKNLKKRFRKIEEDLDKLFAFLSRGTFSDKRIKNFTGHEIYKARIRNSSGESVSSGGFRVVYYLKHENGDVLVLTIYSKTQKTDVSRNEILAILKQENLF